MGGSVADLLVDTDIFIDHLRGATELRLPDAIIAATALVHGLQLSSRNAKDFERVRGLRLRALR